MVLAPDAGDTEPLMSIARLRAVRSTPAWRFITGRAKAATQAQFGKPLGRGENASNQALFKK